jgi:2,5-diketo-D-gluconate reductase A
MQETPTTINIPQIGYGTYLIKDGEASSLVQHALRLGYRHIDTAEIYHNERGVGLGIKESMAELGLSREELFVTTKLWPGNEVRGQESKDYQATIEALDTSLEKLQLDYVDLYLIHAPVAPRKRLEQWRGLVELRRTGKARTIGVSNYSEKHIDEIKAAGLAPPQANQIELHPWSQKPGLVSFLEAAGITIIAYSSLAPLSTWRAVDGQHSGKTEAMRAEADAVDSPFKRMANTYGVSEAQVLLRWGLQKGYAVLPKTTDLERMRQNLDLLSFEIDEQDMAAIAGMDRGGGLAWGNADPVLLD